MKTQDRFGFKLLGKLVLCMSLLGLVTVPLRGAAEQPVALIFLKGTSIDAEIPAKVRLVDQGTGTGRTTVNIVRPNGSICKMTAIFALVADEGIVIARGNAVTCDGYGGMRHVRGYFIDPHTGNGAFKGYCIQRDHNAPKEDWDQNPCKVAEIPAHTKAHFLFKRDLTL